MRRDLVRRGIAADRLHVIPNGVDIDWFRPTERDPLVAQKLGLDGGPVFGFVGSFYRYEGLRFLLKAVPALGARMPKTQILLVGGGEEEPELRTLAARLGGAVIMPGRIPHEQIRQVYAAIDIVVCPRRRSRLTELVTPLKPLEAMSMGQLVLGSNVGGLTELIEPDVTGLLFEADQQESFVEQAVRAGTDRALRERLGTRARAELVQHRSWERIVPGYADVYAAAARSSASRLA